jgi:flavin reductase (DIM6/NTAB) family NADH-FMN oxidoreductase RutF
MALDHAHFKAALRHWASGVTVITTRVGEQLAGMTVSAFSSVSLDPPLVLVCADRTSHTNPYLAEAGVFAVNVLAADQREISRRFSTDGNEALRFEGLACRSGPTGAPWLPGALAVLDCRVVAAHDAGDHVIYVGEVEAAQVREGEEPLVYFDARYRRLEPRG